MVVMTGILGAADRLVKGIVGLVDSTDGLTLGDKEVTLGPSEADGYAEGDNDKKIETREVGAVVSVSEGEIVYVGLCVCLLGCIVGRIVISGTVLVGESVGINEGTSLGVIGGGTVGILDPLPLLLSILLICWLAAFDFFISAPFEPLFIPSVLL
jgi:hypothetical protein